VSSPSPPEHHGQSFVTACPLPLLTPLILLSPGVHRISELGDGERSGFRPVEVLVRAGMTGYPSALPIHPPMVVVVCTMGVNTDPYLSDREPQISDPANRKTRRQWASRVAAAGVVCHMRCRPPDHFILTVCEASREYSNLPIRCAT
jgi:hypothetical protein